jgi:hypothetical protein
VPVPLKRKIESLTAGWSVAGIATPGKTHATGTGSGFQHLLTIPLPLFPDSFPQDQPFVENT